MRWSFDNAQVPESFLAENKASVGSFLDFLREVRDSGEYGAAESSISLPDDEEIANSVSSLVTEKAVHTHLVFLVGIGGSSLGAEAAYQALKTGDECNIFFLDSLDAKRMREVENLATTISSPEEFLVCIVSKSGNTTETIANADILLSVLNKRFPEGGVEARVVVITDEDSALSHFARERGIASLAIPKPVGGRYSVFSAAGLFPLAAAGFDTREFVRGARDVRDVCLSDDVDTNPAVRSALFLAYHYQNGFVIHDTFFFNPALEKLGAWYRQLLAESIGKRKDDRGGGVRVGITPTTSIGSRDLHSIAQLILAGPRDKTVALVKGKMTKCSYSLTEKNLLSSLVPEISGKSVEEINAALFAGAKRAFAEEEIPFFEVELEGVTAREIGGFMQWRMIEVMLLGTLLGVNPFDQPAVESYKKASREFLESRNSSGA